MPNAEQLRQFIVGTIIPPIAGALATWLASTQVFSVFHITANAAAAEITQALVFGVVTGIAYLVNHHILSGHYTPAAKMSVNELVAKEVQITHEPGVSGGKTTPVKGA